MFNKLERVYIGVGSNLLSPKQQVDQAIEALSKLPSSIFIACSSYYRSRPLGNSNQPDFLNMVVVLDTALSAEVLLYYMHSIEYQQGRVRNSLIWQPRTLDLDILLFGKYIVHTSTLIVPHYDMFNREFVVYPLLELDQNMVFPDGKVITDIIQTVPKNGLLFWNSK